MANHWYEDWDIEYSYAGGAKALVADLEDNIAFDDDADRELAISIVKRMSVAGDVNSRFKQQPDLEAGMVYLVPKYSKALKGFERERKRILDEETNRAGEEEHRGLQAKRTKEVRKAYVESLPEVVALNEDMADLAVLVDTLDRMYRMVFNRTTKLEHLSNNYRAELKSEAE
jgi:hypothetical protein